MDIRQRVIRAPEMEVIRLLIDPQKTDAERLATLQKVVSEGRASVVSDISIAADEAGRVNVKNGEWAWMPSELDQEMDRLYMVPTSFQERFIGTSLEGRTQVWTEPTKTWKISADWNAHYSPRGPETVIWPTSWLNTYDHETHKPTGKVIHGWLDWRDTFEQRVITSLLLENGEPKILAIMPPGDQIWPGDRKGRWLDVFIVEARPLGQLQATTTVEKKERLVSPRAWLYGIALSSQETLALLQARQPKEDAALLQTLLARVEEGAARMILCAGSIQAHGQRQDVLSARWHEYPTEMPSIPSAWESRAVGTHLEMDDHALSLTQAVAVPARSEWKLAGDVPEAIMWQPRFRDFQLQTLDRLSPGTRLLSVLQVPNIMRGDGLLKDETLLVFCQREGSAWPEAPAPQAGYEANLLVVEIPASEEAQWQPVADAQETKRFQTLMERVQSGQVPLVAQAMLHLPGRTVGKLAMTEDYPTATEFDPPEPESPTRMRPTALETLPVGSRWEVGLDDENISAVQDPHLRLTHTFSHSTARPVEPGLKETLAIAASSKEDYPGAKHLLETWGEEGLKIIPDRVHCLGLRQPPGMDRDVRHIAFIQIRKLIP
ncbi:hypothetical protein HNQ64_002623 [Prosthecobacter dejongeii]|uniref:Uncharacterized protein n=2 Tax=Prosthecobacter dejongeii TaxID=48465 RepID=A0A7W8DQM9_9BACT|nr:hypothetical protein [Prosthecobacter dejongeii]